MRTSGYKKSELVRHYMILPATVTVISAIIGNVLGYTCLYDWFKGMYYGSYSLPKFVKEFNLNAFVTTTIIPFVLMLLINFILIIYLLSKIIIEKNAQSISMVKILGYTGREIDGLYVTVTTIVVMISLIVTLIISNVLMKYTILVVMSAYSGYLPYYVSSSIFAQTIVLGIVSYAVVIFMLMRKIRQIPMSDALKNAE